jgi:hypothetical protein
MQSDGLGQLHGLDESEDLVDMMDMMDATDNMMDVVSVKGHCVVD